MTNDFIHYKNGELHVENLAVSDIAKEYGTPAYIYSAGHIRGQYNELFSALKDVLPADKLPLLCYACKANSNVAVLKVLQQMGSGLEIVSEGELLRGLKAGFDPKTIVSTGVGKTRSEIAALLKNGIHQINIESLPELERIQEVAQSLDITAEVVFRLNPDIAGGGHDKISTGRACDKFGINFSQALEGFKTASNLSHVDALGFSIHIGSQVFDFSAFEKAFSVLAQRVQQTRDAGYRIKRLDIGGGFPIPYQGEALPNYQQYAQLIKNIILPLDTEIMLEPGRYLVGNAGLLLSKVEFVKETDGPDFLIIDAAMNDLARPAMYDAYHGVLPVQQKADSTEKLYDVVGPICESGDTFGRERKLPELIQDDLVIFSSAGAYGYCMASNYNTRPKIPEILVDGSNIAVINPRETYDDLLDREIIPAWL